MNCCAYRLGLFLIIQNEMDPMHVLRFIVSTVIVIHVELFRVMYAISISATTLGFATAYFPEYMKAQLAGGIIFNMLSEESSIDSLSTEGEKIVIILSSIVINI